MSDRGCNTFEIQTDPLLTSSPGSYNTNLVDGEKELVGIMDAAAFLPHETSSSWHVKFQTDDVDATIARATTLGATIVNAAEDSPRAGSPA